MIKETVDAVRVAEMEAERQISVAKENAEGEKAQIKNKEADYRTEQMQMAKAEADQVVKKCKEYDLKMEKQIEEKVAELKALSDKKMDAAVEAAIHALA